MWINKSSSWLSTFSRLMAFQHLRSEALWTTWWRQHSHACAQMHMHTHTHSWSVRWEGMCKDREDIARDKDVCMCVLLGTEFVLRRDVWWWAVHVMICEDLCDNEPADAIPMSLRSGLFHWRLRDNILHYVLPL